MLQHYAVLREHLDNLHIDALDTLLLSQEVDQVIYILLVECWELVSFTVCIQVDYLKLAQVPFIFDNFIDYMPQGRELIALDANIVESIAIESALVHIHCSQINSLNEIEEVASQCLLDQESLAKALIEAELSLSYIALKKMCQRSTVRNVIGHQIYRAHLWCIPKTVSKSRECSHWQKQES